MGVKLTNIVAYVLAAALIGILIWIVHKQIKEHHLQDDPVLRLLKESLRPVHPIFENMKLYKGDKSYTINKEKTFLCIRDRDGDYYPINMLIYVLLHEVSHSLNTKDIGHTDEFNRIFNELLDRATKLGIYNPSIPIIQDYCE